jgi:hypothetical protein
MNRSEPVNIQTKLRLDRLSVYLERTKAALDRDNLPAAMADVVELGEQARRMYAYLADLYNKPAPKTKSPPEAKS